MNSEPTPTTAPVQRFVIRLFDDDWHYGSLNGRELTLRWHVPFSFREWVNGRWYFAPIKMLNPVRWWRAARDKWNWRMRCRRLVGATHRCYCDTGSMIDGSLIVFGFGVTWFYSHFTGSVPCPCDEAIEEMFGTDG